MGVKSTTEFNLEAMNLKLMKKYDELWKLADEGLVPHEDVQDFIKGKRRFLVESELEAKHCEKPEQKLRDEMMRIGDKNMTDIIAWRLIKQCENEEEFGSQVLQPHKTLDKCLNFIFSKAYEIVEDKIQDSGSENKPNQNQPVGAAFKEDQVIKWALEYYALDDAEQEKKKREEAAEKLRIERENKEKRAAAAIKKKEKTTTTKGAARSKKKTAGDVDKMVETKDAGEPKGAQISMEDYFGSLKGKETKSESI